MMSDSVEYIEDAFTKLDDQVNLEVDQLNISCMTSKNNHFNLDSDGNLTVKTLTTTASSSSTDFLNQVYPIGSIYLCVTDPDPSTLFGGTWERIAKGRTLVGVDESDADFNTTQKVGGSKYMQSHHHDMYLSNGTGEPGYVAAISQIGWGNNFIQSYDNGDGQSGNLQPYFTCYIWTRTA